MLSYIFVFKSIMSLWDWARKFLVEAVRCKIHIVLQQQLKQRAGDCQFGSRDSILGVRSHYGMCQLGHGNSHCCNSGHRWIALFVHRHDCMYFALRLACWRDHGLCGKNQIRQTSEGGEGIANAGFIMSLIG